MELKRLLKRVKTAAMAAILLLSAVFCVPGVTVHAKETKLIAFTFDDGPGPYTSDLIDELDARGAKATFFMLGRNISNYPDAVKKMYDSGHQLANHSWSHEEFSAISDDAITSEIMDTNAELEKYDGEKYHYLRCPYGTSTDYTASVVGMPIIHWTVDTLDWKSGADSVYETAVTEAFDGAIVLAHDIHESSVQGMLRAIDALQDDGYEFVTVSELLRRRGLDPTAGKTFYSAAPTGEDLPADVPVEDPIGTAYVRNSAAMRSGTESDSSISGVIPADSLVLLLNKDDEKKYKVRSPWGEVGYLPVSSLQELEDNAKPSEKETKEVAPVQPPSDPLNKTMRTVSCADIYSTVKGGVTLGRVPAGSLVTVLENTTDTVAMIETSGGTVAYVALKFLEEAPSGAGRNKPEKKDKGIAVTPPESGKAAIFLNLRQSPSPVSVIDSIVEAGTMLTVTETTKKNWCKVKTDDGREGYVQNYFVGTEYTPAKTTTEVNFRPAPNTKKDALDLLANGTEVHILKKVKDWVLVLTSDFRAGYVSAEYVEAEKADDK